MRESGYYPMGAEHDPRAPWNEKEVEERVFDCEVTVTLRKVVPVATQSYIEEPAEYPDYMGGIDTSEVCWEDEYQSRCTPLPSLLERLSELVERWRPSSLERGEAQEVDELLSEARGWELVETEVVEA